MNVPQRRCRMVQSEQIHKHKLLKVRVLIVPYTHATDATARPGHQGAVEIFNTPDHSSQCLRTN